MKIYDFFKPEWKKLVLPAVMIAAFAFVIWGLYDFAAPFDKYACELSEFMGALDAISAGEFTEIDNETIVLDRTKETVTLEQMDKWYETYYNFVNEGMEKDYKILDKLMLFFIFTDPVFPKPCEVGPYTRPAYFPETACYWYISEETYGCFNYSTVEASWGKEEYTPVSWLTVPINLVFICAEWYVFSAIVLGIYRTIVRKI